MLQDIFNGKGHTSTHAGSSQYSRAGSSSACGLAAMNCARHILRLERQGLTGDELLDTILNKETMEVNNKETSGRLELMIIGYR